MRRICFYIALFGILLPGCRQEGVNNNFIPVLSTESTFIFVNTKGKTVLTPPKSYHDATFFYDGLSLVTTTDDKSNTTPFVKTFINKKGIEISNKKYKEATIFNEGIAWVVEENGYPTAINTKGETLFSLKESERVGIFSEGLAPVYFTDDNLSLWGYVNKKGEIVIPPLYDNAGNFHEGLAQVEKNGHEGFGYINKKGEFVIQPQFSEATPFNKNGLAIVAVGPYDQKRYGVVDKNGKYVISPQYDEMLFDGDLFIVRSSGVYGWVNSRGETVINPQFKRVSFFGNSSVTGVSIDGDKFGIINKKGKYVLNPQHDVILSFIGDAAPLLMGGKIGFIDKKGKIVVNPQYNDIAIDYIGSEIGDTYTDLMTINTDYCNIESIVSHLMERSDAATFRGINSSTTFGQIKSLYGDNLSYNSSNSRRSNEQIDLGEGVSITRTTFNFGEALTKSSYNYYERKHETQEITQARISSVEYRLEIEDYSRAYTKAPAIIEKITAALNSTGLTYNISQPSESRIDVTISFN